ncbi:hypothetical protein [Nocardioides pyridinolyticus]
MRHSFAKPGTYRVVLRVTDGTDTTAMRFFVKVLRRG